jgi:hypothetical protein
MVRQRNSHQDIQACSPDDFFTKSLRIANAFPPQFLADREGVSLQPQQQAGNAARLQGSNSEIH